MEKLQYDSFYKFLVSVGAILLTIPMLGIYYLINVGNQILITKEETINLTQESLEILQKREHVIIFIFDFLPYIAALLTIIGLIFLIYGGFKWKKLQKEIDEQTKLKTIEQRVNVEKMTTSEVIEKAIIDTKESNSESYNKDLKVNYMDRFMKIIQIEDFCFNYIENKLSKKYYIQQNVKIAGKEFDIVATSKYSNCDLLYEIKYWNNTPDFMKYKHAIQDFESRGYQYEQHLQRNHQNILIIVIPKEKFEKIEKSLQAYAKKYHSEKVKIEYFEEIEIDVNSALKKINLTEKNK